MKYENGLRFFTKVKKRDFKKILYCLYIDLSDRYEMESYSLTQNVI